jgi:hypothetical protein
MAFARERILKSIFDIKIRNTMTLKNIRLVL